MDDANTLDCCKESIDGKLYCSICLLSLLLLLFGPYCGAVYTLPPEQPAYPYPDYPPGDGPEHQ